VNEFVIDKLTQIVLAATDINFAAERFRIDATDMKSADETHRADGHVRIKVGKIGIAGRHLQLLYTSGPARCVIIFRNQSFVWCIGKLGDHLQSLRSWFSILHPTQRASGARIKFLYLILIRWKVGPAQIRIVR
jgi:hypothetical protein